MALAVSKLLEGPRLCDYFFLAPAHEQLRPPVLELASVKATQITTAARRVPNSWGIDVTESEPEATPTSLWQPTPPLWEVPRFAISRITVDDLHHDWATITDLRKVV